jgi:ABC-type branched-subunit amino acid transport system substrate-binding protein
LTKPYVLRVGAWRSRPAYTEALLIRAVTTGEDSSGRWLGPGMPRFRLTIADAADLVAYLRELGSRPDPGVGADALSIGIILPPGDRRTAASAAVMAALNDYLDGVNHDGGIFGRTVELSVIDAGPDPGGSRSAARTLAIDTALAVVSLAEGAESDVEAVARLGHVPLIAPRRRENAPPLSHVFSLSAGVVGELAALAMQAAHQLDAAHAGLAVLHADDAHGRDVMALLRPVLARGGWRSIDEVPIGAADQANGLPEETVRRIGRADALLIATPDPATGHLLSGLARAGRNPLVLLPGSTTAPQWVPRDLSPGTAILVGFELAGVPPPATDPRAAGPPRAEPVPPAERPGLAAVMLLVEGLRRAGRDVTRAKLIEAIESIHDFSAGHLPPLTFGPRRHVGFTGAQIVPFDPNSRRLLQPIGRIELD